MACRGINTQGFGDSQIWRVRRDVFGSHSPMIEHNTDSGKT
jgi:hypothetical protein